MKLGEMTITEALKYLEPIAKANGLRLNRAKEFRIAKMICANLYNSTI